MTTKHPSLTGPVPEIEIAYKNHSDLALRPVITCARDAYDVFLSNWDDNRLDMVEQVYLLLLNTSKKVLGLLPVSSGGVDFAVFESRIILATALKANAASILVAHNHPSGSLVPSSPDKKMTLLLAEGCRSVGLVLLDHLIITRQGYYSIEEDAAEIVHPPSQHHASPSL